MKILITGGAGFIGSHLCEILVGSGCEVTVFDNFSSGSVRNLAAVIGQVGIVEGDIGVYDSLRQVKTRFDAVVHLAAIASVIKCQEDPIGSHLTNGLGALNVLEYARQSGCKRVVLASSAAVYGNPQTLPVTETSTVGPLSVYAVDKLYSELVGETYQRSHNIETYSLRLFNVYGPRQNPHSPYSGVISKFVDAAIHGTPCTIFGDGLQTRDFIYVSDLVTVISKIAKVGANERTFNVGTGIGTSLLTLIEILETIANKKLTVSFASKQAGDVRFSFCDPKRLRSEGLLTQVTSMEQGLRTMYDWQNVNSMLH